jgi:hypothetical protein
MKLKLPIFVYCCLLPGLLIAQQERQLFIYNVGFGSLTSGIGAVINKSKGTDWKHAFLKGCWQGGIGGALSFAGKKAAYLITKNQNLLYGWPSKLLHAAGTSIIENAALNEPFLQNWNIDYGPIRFDFSINGQSRPKIRLLPYGLYAIIVASRNAYFDPGTTLLTGNVSFYSRSEYVQVRGGSFKGVSYGRSFVYADRIVQSYVIPHELIHIYQFREYQVFNTWFKPLTHKVTNKTIRKIFDRYVFADIPFFSGFYLLEYSKTYNYFRNFYEFEAERFASNRDVPK